MGMILIIGAIVMAVLIIGLLVILFLPELTGGESGLKIPFSSGSLDEYNPLITGLADNTYVMVSPKVGGGYYTYLKIEAVDLFDISDENLEKRIRGFAKFLEANVKGIQFISFSAKISCESQKRHLQRRIAKAKTEKQLQLLELEMQKIYEAELTDQQKVFYFRLSSKKLKSLKKHVMLLAAITKDFPYEQIVGGEKIAEIEKKLVE
jgi:CRISPR/Cas system-associated endoribonuclease Cas2